MPSDSVTLELPIEGSVQCAVHGNEMKNSYSIWLTATNNNSNNFVDVSFKLITFTRSAHIDFCHRRHIASPPPSIAYDCIPHPRFKCHTIFHMLFSVHEWLIAIRNSCRSHAAYRHSLVMAGPCMLFYTCIAYTSTSDVRASVCGWMGVRLRWKH